MSRTVAMSDKFFIIFWISLKNFAGFYLNQNMGTVKGGDVKLSNSRKFQKSQLVDIWKRWQVVTIDWPFEMEAT